MRVIEVISDTNIGGAGVLLVNRLSYTDVNKYHTMVIIPNGSALCGRIKKTGAEVLELNCRGDASFQLLAVFQYIKIFIKQRPDIVNCHGCLSARLAAKLCGIPVKLCTRHCFFPVQKKNKIFRSISGCLNSWLSDGFIAVAYAARDNLIELGVRPEKISVIINGAMALREIDRDSKKALKEKYGISEDTTILCLCARLELCKGHYWFVKVINQLLENGKKIAVFFVGDGSQKENLISLCRTLKILENVYFTGFVNDVAPIMNIADININCSVGTETSSLALSEGMSLGIPAVVSDYGGNPYMVEHGVNGFVCRQEDYIEMAEYIQNLIEDKTLYRQISAASKKRFLEELNAEKMTEKTNRLYDAFFSKHTATKSNFEYFSGNRKIYKK